jgi:leucyl/phenylalanyl-tRNA--protein transferase
MVFQLSSDYIAFPNPAFAEEDGLLAIGGDLSLERLKLAYDSGIFPWYSEGEPIMWFAPHNRCVLFPQKIKISKSMRQVMRAHTFTITKNKAFDEVIENCASNYRRGQEGTWINKDMQAAYINMFHEGLAMSIEVWHRGKLVGGLYGIIVGNVFCGESMFSLMSNASKAGFIWLCENGGFELIDCQMPNPHLTSLGAEMISRNDYLPYLYH